MTAQNFIHSASHTHRVQLGHLADDHVAIHCSGFVDNDRGIQLTFGPLRVAMHEEKVIALGNALIDAAHHRLAAIAEYRQSLAAAGADQAVQS